MNRFKQEIVDLVQDVCRYRDIDEEEYSSGRKNMRLVLARRAVATIYSDRHDLKNGGGSIYHSWVELSRVTGLARSTCFDGPKQWVTQEGSQDPEAEESHRQKGHMPPKSYESIHQIARRVCKDRGRNGAYFCNRPPVNCS
jgi:hypothetical protein